MNALTAARAAVSAFACSVGWLSALVYWLTHIHEIRTVWMAYFEKYFSKPLSHYLEETDSDNEMMMRILQGGEQMGMIGQEGKENDVYLGSAKGPGLDYPKNMANVRVVSDLKAILAAQFESESKKNNAAQNNHNQEMIQNNDENDLSIKVNQALYPNLSNDSHSHASQHKVKGGTGTGLTVDVGAIGADGKVTAGGGGGGPGSGVNTPGPTIKSPQRTVLRGSRGSRGSQNSKRKANKRISMGK